MISLDLAGLVLVASRILNLDEATVLGMTDLEAAAAVLASAREDSGGSRRQAAILLHGLVRGRVFGPHSGAVGLMAALQLLALNGREAGDLGPPAVVREWLAAVAGGRIGVDDVASWLDQATSGRRTDMFERFTDRARQAVVLAQEEARRHRHAHVGTEHILLGLISEGQGVGARALKALEIPPEEIRAQILEIVPPGDEAPTGHIAFTPRSKKVLELSLREALQLGHNYIGTEHLLLGLVREHDGVAAQVLAGRGADQDAVRQEVVRQLAAGGGERAAVTMPSKEGLVADIGALYEEIVRLSREVHRLSELLRRHGIEPDEGSSRSA